MDYSYHYTDNFLIDPYEEERRAEKRRSKEMKKMKEHCDMLEYVADAQYGIPTKCPCGGSIKFDVSPTPKFEGDFDTLPGSRYFTCSEFKDDGLHFRQPWVLGVQEEIEKLQTKVADQQQTIEDMRKEIQNNTEELAKLKELVAVVKGVVGV